MATTLGQLLGKVRFRLQGLGVQKDTVAETAAAITDSATSIPLDDATGFARGSVAEIDFEMVRIKTADAATNTLTVRRGHEGTDAVAHEAGVEVLMNPTWPRGVVAQEINGVLTEIYPDLYAVDEYESTIPSDPGEPLTLPAGAVGVIAVYLEPRSTPGSWVLMDRWDYQPDGDLSLRLGLGYPGQAVRVVYAKRPGTFDLSAPAPLALDFETVTGLPERVADLVALGVASRLAPFMHLARTTTPGAEARADAQAKPADAVSVAARLLYSEFRARVQAEQMALVKEHPIRPHKVAR
jgi:hypothetical protein